MNSRRMKRREKQGRQGRVHPIKFRLSKIGDTKGTFHVKMGTI